MILLGIWILGFGVELYWNDYWPYESAKKFYIETGALTHSVTISFDRLEFTLHTPLRKKDEYN